MKVLNKLTISDKVIRRPSGIGNHFIPNPTFSDFWEEFYFELLNSKKLTFPLENASSKINTFFGYFGFRFHPIKFEADYYHIGIDIDQQIGQKVYPVSNGIFEYSGYGPENGKYIMISHPEFQTNDGYVMYSLYLHLEEVSLTFTFIEKILRTIGLRNFTNKPVGTSRLIGFSGDSGNSKNIFPHLHLQIEFRNKLQDKIIVIDPARALGLFSAENKTKNIKNFDEFRIFCTNHEIELSKWLPLINKYEHDNNTSKQGES